MSFSTIGTFRIVDDDLTTVLLDLNDQNGTSGTLPTGITTAARELRLRTPPREATRYASKAYPGGITAVSQDGLVVSDWRQVILSDATTDIDDLRAFMMDVDQYLREGRIIEVLFTGSATTHYIRLHPSESGGLFGDEAEDTFRAITSGQYPQGIPISVVRDPYLERATSTLASAVAIDNGVLAGELAITNPGNALSPLKVSVKVAAAGAKTSQCYIGLRSKGDLTEFRTLYQYAPAGPVALQTYWQRIHRKVITPTATDAISGRFLVLQQMTLDAADSYEFQVRFASADQNPAGGEADVVPIDNSDYSAWTEPAVVPLGYVTFEETGQALVIEVWARSDAAGAVTWGNVKLMPADERLVIVSSPGQRQGRFGLQTWFGDNLTLSGATLDDEDNAILDALNDYAETEATVLPAGEYTVEFKGTARNTQRTNQVLGELRIYEDAAQIAASKIRAKRGQVSTTYGGDSPKRVRFTANGTSAYKARVIQTAATQTYWEIKLVRLRRWFVPTVASSRQFVVDSPGRAAYIADNAGVRFWPAQVQGYLDAPPGDSVLVFDLGDVPAQAALSDADPRGPLASSITARAATVTVEARPMDTH